MWKSNDWPLRSFSTKKHISRSAKKRCSSCCLVHKEHFLRRFALFILCTFGIIMIFLHRVANDYLNISRISWGIYAIFFWLLFIVAVVVNVWVGVDYHMSSQGRLRGGLDIWHFKARSNTRLVRILPRSSSGVTFSGQRSLTFLAVVVVGEKKAIRHKFNFFRC